MALVAKSLVVGKGCMIAWSGVLYSATAAQVTWNEQSLYIGSRAI